MGEFPVPRPTQVFRRERQQDTARIGDLECSGLRLSVVELRKVMLFCKSSTVKPGTIALICTVSCVVATTISLVVPFMRMLAGHSADLQARPWSESLSGGNVSTWPLNPANSGRAYASTSRINASVQRCGTELLPMRLEFTEICARSCQKTHTQEGPHSKRNACIG